MRAVVLLTLFVRFILLFIFCAPSESFSFALLALLSPPPTEVGRELSNEDVRPMQCKNCEILTGGSSGEGWGMGRVFPP